MNKGITVLCRALLALILFVTVAPLSAQPTNDVFTRADAMIAMRDGVRLYTQVYTPNRSTEPLPILLLSIGDLTSAQTCLALSELVVDGYNHCSARHPWTSSRHPGNRFV